MQDPRFATFAERQKHFRTVWDEVERQAARKTNAQWIELLSRSDVPFSVVNRLEDLPNDPHLASVDFWTVAEHPTEGPMRFPANPMKMSATPAGMTRMPPTLGQHSAEVLAECGYHAAEVSQLIGPGGPCWSPP
jgi:crotonobetainyl-CoA:carnitine CoA-transferase CaiB-like acyl-CoA transferase